MLITLLLILSFSSLTLNILIYKLYKEIAEYRNSMFEGGEEYEDLPYVTVPADEPVDEPEYTYDNPPKPIKNMFDVEAYKKRMKDLREEQEQEGLYTIAEAVNNDMYFTGVEEPED